jgi:transcriptional regulator with XRE-family HTH domain
MRLRELARSADISPSSLARIEAGQVSPNLATVEQVARALDMDAPALLGYASATGGGRDAGTRGGGQDLSGDAERLLGAFERMEAARRRLVLTIAEELSGSEKRAQGKVARETGGPATKGRDRSPRHYVQGWAPSTARRELEDELVLEHTAGEQFSKPFQPMQAGDVLWVVYVDEGKLHLIGRMEVTGRGTRLRSDPDPENPLFTQREAERILGRDDVWEAREHLIARKGTEEPLDDVELDSQLVRRLQFQTGSGLSEVAVNRGRVAGQAFRSIRLLTPSSATEFERVWRRVS